MHTWVQIRDGSLFYTVLTPTDGVKRCSRTQFASADSYILANGILKEIQDIRYKHQLVLFLSFQRFEADVHWCRSWWGDAGNHLQIHGLTAQEVMSTGTRWIVFTADEVLLIYNPELNTFRIRTVYTQDKHRQGIVIDFAFDYFTTSVCRQKGKLIRSDEFLFFMTLEKRLMDKIDQVISDWDIFENRLNKIIVVWNNRTRKDFTWRTHF